MLTTIVTVLAAVATVFVAMNFFGRQNRFEVDGRTAIVTGGSQGYGLAIAKQLAAKGANVVIVAQNVPKLEGALKQIQTAGPKGKHLILSYDLRSPDSASLIIEKVTEWNGTPDIVFNCAGFCVPGFFATTEIEDHRSQMDTVYWTATYMAHAILRKWMQPSKGKTRHLIFTASVVAFFPLAGYAAYNPAKAAMRALADTLNQEIEVYNGTNETAPIKVSIVFPGGIDSPGYQKEEETKPMLTRELEKDDKPEDPDKLAALTISGLEAGQFLVTTTTISHIMKGWAMGASQRKGFMDYIWSLLGPIIVLFIVPDFLSKCRTWGKQKGMAGAR